MCPRLLISAAASLFLLACGSEKLPALALQVGPETLLPFTPRAAIVRYMEHPTAPDEMRLLLASYEIGCSEFQNPEPGQVFVTVTLRVPAGEVIDAGKFPWSGDLDVFAHAKEPAALPFVRLSEEGRALPAGGFLRLDGIEKKQYGLVSGELLFQDGGEGEPRTAGLMGPFRARICELSLDESRRKKEE